MESKDLFRGSEFSVASFTSGASDKNLLSLSTSNSTYSIGSPSTSRTENKRSCNKKILTLQCCTVFTLFISIAAVLLAIAAITTYQLQERDSTNVEVLKQQENMSAVIDDLIFAQTELQQKIKALQNMNTALSHTLNETVDNVNKEVQTISKYISGNVSSVVSQMTALEQLTLSQVSIIQETRTRLDELNSSIATNNISLYDNCYKRTISCEIPTATEFMYWRLCSTTWIQADVQDYYITGMQCEYESIYFGYHVSSVLSKFANLSRCRCNVLAPNTLNGDIGALPLNLIGTCSLVVTYCPLQHSV